MIDEILQQTKNPELIIQERKGKSIVIGAPHHGYMRGSGRRGDKNVGFIAKKIAEQLDLCVVIACNYRFDPNKDLTTDYSQKIINWKPIYLIEIHGHANTKKCNDYCIEISSGNIKRNKESMYFAKTLQTEMNKYPNLRNYNVHGDFNNIRLKAKRSATINTDLWIPFHLELPPSLRIDRKDRNKPPEITDDFIKCLIKTINKTCKLKSKE